MPTLLFGETLHHPDLYWRTGFLVPEPMIYLEHDGGATLVVTPLELGRARREFTRGEARSFTEFGLQQLRETAPTANEIYAGLITALLAEKGVGAVRVDSDLPVGIARALEARDVSLDVVDGMFTGDMRRKRPDEVEAIAASQASAARAIARARDILAEATARDGKLYHGDVPLTSAYVAGEMDTQMLREGFRTEATIVAGGAGAADQHVIDTGHLLAGEPVVVDVFPRGTLTRYCGDMCRTYVPGQPDETWLRMYAAVREAHGAALRTIRAGVPLRVVHGAVVGVLEGRGFAVHAGAIEAGAVPAMNHITGHGIGLRIHEAPGIADNPGELREGDVVAFEPGLYSLEHGCVRLEDVVEVTATGCRELVDLSLDWEL